MPPLMGRESIEVCPLCGSLCRAVECEGLRHKHYGPIILALSEEERRLKILGMLRSAVYTTKRLDRAIEMLRHVEMFLHHHGYKFMHLEVKRALDHLTDRRGA